jgi:hypothetical protein
MLPKMNIDELEAAAALAPNSYFRLLMGYFVRCQYYIGDQACVGDRDLRDEYAGAYQFVKAILQDFGDAEGRFQQAQERLAKEKRKVNSGSSVAAIGQPRLRP